MGLLERLNVFKRIKRLEDSEKQLLESVDILHVKADKLEERSKQVEVALEHILDSMDRRAELLDELNRKIWEHGERKINSLDMFPDLDVIEKHGT